MDYIKWNEKIINDFSNKSVSDLYDKGYLFTRIKNGLMHQTRSARINLQKFKLSSENRRILKKTGAISITKTKLPLTNYSWKIGKIAKDFYEIKARPNVFSANKIKELITKPHNFNMLLSFDQNENVLGYAICYENASFVHYAYPFYDLNKSSKDMGLGMIIRAIQYAQEDGMKYIYLGSLQRVTDTYKLQFDSLEWFDGENWQTDIEEVKKILASATMEQ